MTTTADDVWEVLMVLILSQKFAKDAKFYVSTKVTIDL